MGIAPCGLRAPVGPDRLVRFITMDRCRWTEQRCHLLLGRATWDDDASDFVVRRSRFFDPVPSFVGDGNGIANPHGASRRERGAQNQCEGASTHLRNCVGSELTMQGASAGRALSFGT